MKYSLLTSYSLNIDISIDPFTGRNPSYCFVDLDDNEDADAVISELEGHMIRGRPMKINYDTGKRAHRPQRLETRLANGERRSFDFSSASTASPFVFDRYAALLCKEMLRPQTQMALSIGAREAEEVELRLRALARLERVWGKSGAAAAAGGSARTTSTDPDGRAGRWARTR